ncbi:MAG: FKBP-type peptidyl-prolyl cis-trans isomerase [Chloroflexi bacterium]|nr:FKBP-type peptidyl-prolyl cis-trans isomerase [Chloroflexota bacterium]
MKKIVTTLFMVLLMVLAACGPAPAADPAVLTATAVAAEEAAAPEATAEPAPAVVEEPAETEAGEEAAVTAPINTDEEITFTLLTEGDGETPVLGDWVVIHIVGKLEDGTELFNTTTVDSPIVYPYGDELMLAGVNEAVALMQVGDKASVIIPPALGLGAEGGGTIPPNATLIFDMELVSIPRVEVTEMEPGDGELPQPGSTLVVNYVGTLEDGTEFDSSYSRNQPFEFTLGLGQVIPGWEIGMAQIRPGGKSRLVIPSELGYGNQEIPGIPANSTLIFEVELLEVK